MDPPRGRNAYGRSARDVADRVHSPRPADRWPARPHERLERGSGHARRRSMGRVPEARGPPGATGRGRARGVSGVGDRGLRVARLEQGLGGARQREGDRRAPRRRLAPDRERRNDRRGIGDGRAPSVGGIRRHPDRAQAGGLEARLHGQLLHGLAGVGEARADGREGGGPNLPRHGRHPRQPRRRPRRRRGRAVRRGSHVHRGRPAVHRTVLLRGRHRALDGDQLRRFFDGATPRVPDPGRRPGHGDGRDGEAASGVLRRPGEAARERVPSDSGDRRQVGGGVPGHGAVACCAGRGGARGR